MVIRSLSMILLISVGFLMSGAAEAAPVAAAYYESYNCPEIGQEGAGSSADIPERVVIDHIDSWWHSFTFTGTTETQGDTGPPLAAITLSARAFPDGEPGSAIARCHAGAQIVYEVEANPNAGVEPRVVPLKVRSRGGITASASSWGGRANGTIKLRTTQPGWVGTFLDNACEGSVFHDCPVDWKPSVDFDASHELFVNSDDIIEISIQVTVAVFAGAEAWEEWQSSEDRGGNSTITAWIDPVIYIDPTWEYADDYDLVFSAGIAPQADEDEDGVPDAGDNCPELENPAQADADEDEFGNLCDNCPNAPNGPDGGTCTDGDEQLLGADCSSAQGCGEAGFCSQDQEDVDGQGPGDACDPLIVPEVSATLGLLTCLLSLYALRRWRRM